MTDDEDMIYRVIKDGEGWSVNDVERALGISGRRIRNIRRNFGREPERGLKPEFRFELDDAKRDRVIQLDAEGHGASQIALSLGISPSTVRRVLDR